jgi:hypothetical protein
LQRYNLFLSFFVPSQILTDFLPFLPIFALYEVLEEELNNFRGFWRKENFLQTIFGFLV